MQASRKFALGKGGLEYVIFDSQGCPSVPAGKSCHSKATV
jgi:hypothetical protein